MSENNTVIQNDKGQFLAMALSSKPKWVDEYPDATKFHKGTLRSARAAAKEMKGKMVKDYGLTTENVVADFTGGS